MYLLSALLASAALTTALPDSVLFSDVPATIEQMKTIEGEWTDKRKVPVLKLSTVRPGWMSLKAEKGFWNWVTPRAEFPVAITVHDDQLFINMAVRYVMPIWAQKWEYQGKECYGAGGIVKVGDGIEMLDLDEDKMRAANSWHPQQMQTWEGEQMGCGNLVIRAESARGQRVVVVLDPTFSWFHGPLHRIPAGGLDKPRKRH